MGMEIDSLEIAIQAQAREASREIDGLYQKLGNVASALNRTASGYRSAAKEAGRMAAAFRSIASIRIPNFSGLIQQMESLSKIDFKGMTNKKFEIKVDVDVPKSASQVQFALEKAMDAVKVDSSKFADKLIDEYSLTGKAASTVRRLVSVMVAEMSAGFDGSGLSGVSSKFNDAWNQIDEVIREHGKIEAETVRDNRAMVSEQYAELAETMRGQSIVISDELKRGIGRTEFAEMIKEFPGLFVRSVSQAKNSILDLNSVWESWTAKAENGGKAGQFADILSRDVTNDADQVMQLVQALRIAKEEANKVRISGLGGESADLAGQSVRSSVLGMSTDITNALKNGFNRAMQESSKDLMIDVGVNQEKIVRDIQSAINSASNATFKPVKVTLDIDKANIKNRVSEELQNISEGNLTSIANAYKELVTQFSTLNTVAQNAKGVNNMINSIRRLADTDMGKFDSVKFSEMTSGIAALASMPDVSGTLSKLINSLIRLSGAASNMNAATSAIPAFTTAIRDMLGAVGQANADKGTVALLNTITRLSGSGQGMADAAQNMPLLTNSIREFFVAMSQAPVVHNNTLKMTQALARLAKDGGNVRDASVNVNHGFSDMSKSGSKLQSVLRGLSTVGNKIKSAFQGLATAVKDTVGNVAKGAGKIVAGFKNIGRGTNHIQKATLSLKNLLQVALGFYGIRTLFNWGKEALKLSSDLTEVQNVVENSFGTEGTKAVEEFASTSIKSLGMSELTAKQVASRFQAMGNAMGITAGQVAKATEQVSGRMEESYRNVGDGMGNMSIRLTMLAADMASFYNVEQDTVAEALNAVYTGQTRPLRQYGLDLTQATLQEWAMKQGIDADIQSMSQAEKTLLRYQYVMANTSTIQGDFARTSMTWANQIRILRQQFEVLGRTIGDVLVNTFRPLVVWLNTAMEQVIAFAETIGNALGKIFGWQIMHTPASNAADVYATLTDSLEDTAGAGDDTSSSLQDATKAAEDYKNTVLGFDELNKLNDVSERTSTPSSGSGGGSGAPSSAGLNPVSASGADFTSIKQPTWFEDYKSEIDSLRELGDYINTALTDAMNRIKWEEIYAKASGFGTGLANFLNGLISPGLFSAVASTISSSLNTALHFLDRFGNTFSWTNFGNSISAGLITFFETFDWKLAAKDFLTLTGGISTAIGAALDSFNASNGFELVGTKVGGYVKDVLTRFNYDIVADNFVKLVNGIKTAISSALDKMEENDGFGVVGRKVGHAVRKVLNTNDWQLSARNFSRLTNGIIRSIRSAVDEVGQNNGFFFIGSQISGFVATALGGIEWESEVYPAANSFASGLAGFLNGLFDENTFSTLGSTVAGLINTALHFLDTFGTEFEWGNFGISLAAGINSFFNTFNFEMLASAFNNWGLGILESLKTMLVTIRWFEIGQNIGNFIRAIKWENWFTGIADLLAAAVQAVIDTAKGIIDPSGLGNKLTGALDNIKTSCDKFVQAVDWATLAESVKKLVDALAPAVAGFAEGLTTAFSILADIGAVALNAIGIAFNLIANAINSLPEGLVEDFGKGLGIVAGALVTINGLDRVVSIIGGVTTKILGFGTATGTATTTVANAGGATTVTTGIFGQFAQAILKSSGFLEGALVSGAVEAGKGLQLLDEQTRGENGQLSEMGGVMDSIATQFSPEMESKIRDLKNELENNGATADEAASAFADFFTGEHVAPEKLESAMGVVRTEMSLTDEQGYLLDETLKRMGEQSGTTGQQMTMSQTDYIGFKDVLNEMVREGTLGGDMIEHLDGVLQQQVGAGTAKEAYDKVKTALSEMGVETDTFDTKVQEKVPGAFSTISNQSLTAEEKVQKVKDAFWTMAQGIGEKAGIIKSQAGDALGNVGEKADEADTKTGTFQTNLFAFAGGIFAQAGLMALMGTTFGTMGDKSETAKGKVNGLKDKVGEFVRSVKDKASEAETNSKTVGEIVPKAMGEAMENNKGKLELACTNMSKTIKDKTNEGLGWDGTSFAVVDVIGQNVDSGLGNSITENAGDVEDAAEKLADTSILGVLDTTLDENSPSKEAEKRGKYVNEGLANGISGNATTVTEAVSDLVEDMLGEIAGQDALADFLSAGEDLAAEVKSGMETEDFSGVTSTWYSGMNFPSFNTDMYNAGQAALSNFKRGLNASTMPVMYYYVDSYDGHDVDGDRIDDSWTPVYKATWRAKGGFPNMGELFVANEAGPEMIGKMGSKNVVANNLQITEGIKAAVVDGMMEVAMATGGNSDNSVPYVINMRVVTDDDETLARRVERGRMKRESRYSPTPAYV